MIITVLSRQEVKNYIPRDNSAIIRITSQYPFRELKGNFNYSLEMFFDDISELVEDDFDNMSNIITKEEAFEIIVFLHKIIKENCEELVVHCDYGKGRSPAVAAAISNILNIEFDINSYPDINMLVYDTIISANKN